MLKLMNIGILLFGLTTSAVAKPTYTQGGHLCPGCETCDSASCACHKMSCEAMREKAIKNSSGTKPAKEKSKN